MTSISVQDVEALPERIRQKIAFSPGCWIWLASIGRGGYGQKWSAGRMRVAHRVVYEAVKGPIPSGLTLDHLCRVRRCVNPAHLEPVTNRENILRGSGASAVHARKVSCINGHPLSGENLYVYPDGERCCRTCRRAHQSAWLARRRQS